MPYLSDPEIWGPGVWFNIHLFAAKANDTESKEFFITFINITVENLPCLQCRKHASQYLKHNPLIGFLTDSDSDGLFRWSWIFHNVVNTRLRKTQMSWNVAHDMFYDKHGVCAGDCGSPGKKVSVYHKSRKSSSRKQSGITYVDW